MPTFRDGVLFAELRAQADALRQQIEQHNAEMQRLDALIQQTPAPTQPTEQGVAQAKLSPGAISSKRLIYGHYSRRYLRR